MTGSDRDDKGCKMIDKSNAPTLGAIVVGYAVLNVVSLVLYAIHFNAALWERGGAVAILVPLGLLVCLLRRRRWAWIVSVVVTLSVVIIDASTRALGVARLSFDLLPLGLLLSRQMRRYIGIGALNRHLVRR